MQITKNKKQRTCILILGMHRSGTSAIAGCFSVLGFNLGNQLFPPDEPNEKGYFENVLINRFNDSILEAIFVRWHDTLFLPDTWWLDERVEERKPELKSLLENEFGKDDDFVIKDPRISILLPLYLEIFNDMSITPKVIVNFRNPFEVAESLKKRDNLSYSKSLLLWMDATLKAEVNSRSLLRIFLEYDSLLNNTVGVVKSVNELLELNIKFDDHNKTNELGRFIEKKLKHHTRREGFDNLANYHLINQLFDKLHTLNLKSLKVSDQKYFDKINQLFYSEFKFYNGIEKTNKAILKIETGNKITAYSADSIAGENTIRFTINNKDVVSGFILFPSSRRMAFKLQSTVLTTSSGQEITVKGSGSNAEKVLDDGTMFFESEFPQIKFKLPEPRAITRIQFSYQVLAMDGNTYRASIKYRNSIESSYLEGINALQQENERILRENEINIDKLEQKWKDEIAALKTQLHDYKSEKNNLLAENAILKNETATLKNHLTKAEKEVSVLKNQLDALQQETNKLENEIAELNSQIAIIDKENAILNDKNNHLNIENNKLLAVNERLLANNEAQLSTFNKSLEEIKNSQAKLINEKDKLISNYVRENTELGLGNNTLNQKLDLLTIELTEVKQKYDSTIENLNLKNDKLSEEITLLNSLLEEITNSKSWKIGRTLTWPIRKPKERLRDSE